jgi:PAS domain S-box-containing protein
MVQSKDSCRIFSATILIILAAIVGFEIIIYLAMPGFSVGNSRIAMLVFSTFCAAAASYVLYRRQARLNERLLSEVAERRHAEELLRRSEEKYRDLFENANDAIFVVDADLRYIEFNRKAIDVMGYSREELLSMKITDIVPPEQEQRSTEEFKKLRTDGSYENFVGKVRTRNGKWIDVEVNSSAILDEGKLVGSRDIMRDITERKKAEAEREQLISELRVALNKVKTLSGLLPICACCKKIRDDKGYWTRIESYIHRHSNAEFTHGLCPDCAKRTLEEYEQTTTSGPPPGMEHP